MLHVTEFFKHLPKKKCKECLLDIEEQAECYSNLCAICNHPA